MKFIKKYLYLIIIIDTCSGHGFNFFRVIEALQFPYYKIIFSIGLCKDRIIYSEHKIWGSVRMNRILDVYYKSKHAVKISRVEIKLVINNTDCLSLSDTGVGLEEFSAVLILPMSVGIVFYDLIIYTCLFAKPDESEVYLKEINETEITTEIVESD